MLMHLSGLDRYMKYNLECIYTIIKNKHKKRDTMFKVKGTMGSFVASERSLQTFFGWAGFFLYFFFNNVGLHFGYNHNH